MQSATKKFLLKITIVVCVVISCIGVALHFYNNYIIDRQSSYLTENVKDSGIIKQSLEKQVRNVSYVFMTALIWLVFSLLFYMYYLSHKSNKSVKDLAFIDSLTGLNNMNKFENDFKEKDFSNNRYALIAYNVKNFKGYNELFGYDNGDKLLKRIANIFEKITWNDEAFARDVADRFYLLLRAGSKDELNSRLEIIFHEISHCMDDETKKYKVISCAGVYLITDKDKNIGINYLLDYSLMAMKTVKSIHENTIVFYDDNMHEKLLQKNNIEKIMRTSLDNEEFLVYLQPKINLETEELAGAEALIRWKHPEKGLIFPNTFIPIFEENGFITKVDLYMLENVVKIQRKWLDKKLNCVPISVNQSRLLLYNPNYIKTVTEIVDKYNVSHDLIELELTETAVFDNKEKVIKTFKKFRDLGFKTSMDDFGSGYSSLNMLKDLELDVIKLDRDFFADSSRSGRGKEIVESIIKLINSLNMTSLAEGLETKEQVDFLKSINCTMVQGYYYAKPMPINEFEEKYYKHLSSQRSKTAV